MLKVLSLFGGMECGRIALEKIGAKVESYHSAEFDPYPVKLVKDNFPDVVHIGSVTEVDGGGYEWIDLLVGGPPCQDLSIAGKRAGLIEGKRSSLFFEYVRILKEAKPKFFLVENVASMPKEAKELMTSELFGIEPVLINSALVSAQNRKRLFWVGKRNADGTYSKVDVKQPEDRGLVLRDILEDIPLDDPRWKPLPEKFVGIVTEKIEKFSTDRKAFSLTATYDKACVQNHLKHDRTVLLQIPHGHFEWDVREDKSSQVTRSSWEHNNLLVSGRWSMKGLNANDDPEKSSTVTAGMWMGGHSGPVVLWQFRRTDLRIHADQENCPTLTANMGTGWHNVPIVISEPYCLNPQVDGKQPSLADRIYHDEAKSTAVTTSFITNVMAGRAVNRRIGEDGKRKDDDKSVPLELKVEVNDDPTKSNTLTTFDKDNVVVTAPQYLWRKLTVRECARLQTVPDSYRFDAVSDSRAYKAIGNGWTVDVIAHIFEQCGFGKETVSSEPVVETSVSYPETVETKRYVVCAAVRTSDGQVHTGRRHSDVFTLIGALWGIAYHQGSEQGFVDNAWNFLTRSEAFEIAKKAGQFLEGKPKNRGILYSEDIY